ncbi:MAG: tRNA 4-thiouridine(8) synthase ThiI [Candidatus Aenigmarchaeota archaeon]|nr:tRNA 4-thiouridine(8) synthase ThiI [Candidatus Aenigmarchaeota archaeon]
MHDMIGVHYSEIALKGQNRGYFEKSLRQNVRRMLKGEECSIESVHDRILIRLLPGANEKSIGEKLQCVFGISHFYPAFSCGKSIEEIGLKAREIFQQVPKDKTFKVKSSRADKKFPIDSQELNRRLGEIFYNDGYTVDVKKPDVTLHVDIIKDFALVYTEKTACYGGMPVGTSGKVVVLFSGGIDSPVASWYAMKRGCRPVYVHFHAMRSNADAAKSKIGRLVQSLCRYSGRAKLYLVPYDTFQVSCASDYELVVFRRFINRVAEKIAALEGAKVLVTGESIAQVASQTLDNMAAIEEAVKIPIIRPLAGMNKDEIIAKAEEIGTYELSLGDYKDCCSIVSRHPRTKANLEKIKADEEKMNIEKLAEETLAQAEMYIFD